MLLLIVQIFVALLFLMAGSMKIMKPKREFEKKMAWAKGFSAAKLKKIGMFEILGAFGITLPLWLDILPWLSGWAALGLAIITFLAFIMHVKRKENGSVIFTIVVFIALLYLNMNFWTFFS